MRKKVATKMSDQLDRAMLDNGIRYNPEYLNRIRKKRREEKQAAMEAERDRVKKELEDQKREKEAKKQRNLDEARERQKAAIERNISANIAVKEIISIVAEKHLMKYKDVVGPRRTHRVVAARWEAMRTVHEMKPWMSVAQIARAFNRDHTTALHALGRLAKTKGKKCQ